MRKLVLAFIATLILGATFTSCNSWREVVYFQDLDSVQLHNKITETSIRIRPGDQMTIMIFGADKYLIMPYNQTLNSVSENSLGSGGTRDTQLPYDVDENGDIQFPVLGKIHVAGMTCDDVRRYLHNRLDETIRDMTCFVAIENFRINVMGEVYRPGTFPIKNNSVTFMEALAMAGDMKLTANRHKVQLIRFEDGQVKHYNFDMTKSDLLDSKQMYLQQNDVIYVPPIAARAESERSNQNTRSWLFSGIAALASLISIIVALSK
ncbi:MAG: polysaccharide biosynthesis/export family protein [Bacteroidaceae bacterium]|nr:polysaccharide biosynthesis/export family protein [Bacteroidaceae bacterium]